MNNLFCALLHVCIAQVNSSHSGLKNKTVKRYSIFPNYLSWIHFSDKYESDALIKNTGTSATRPWGEGSATPIWEMFFQKKTKEKKRNNFKVKKWKKKQKSKSISKKVMEKQKRKRFLKKQKISKISTRNFHEKTEKKISRGA